MRVGAERLANIALVLAAAAIAASVVHREFFTEQASASATSNLKPVRISDWSKYERDVSRAGVLTGTPSARVQIVEFADFQCPFCKQYEQTLRTVVGRYGTLVSRTFVYYPLDMHAYARSAARAAECANNQGAFDAMSQALYARQDSLGVKAWESYARDAAVPDLNKFSQCAASTDSVARVVDGLALAHKLKLDATPTIIVNGWKFEGGPPDSVLTRVIDDLIAGKTPRDAK